MNAEANAPSCCVDNVVFISTRSSKLNYVAPKYMLRAQQAVAMLNFYLKMTTLRSGRPICRRNFVCLSVCLSSVCL